MAERRRLASLPDAELERALRRLGRHVAFPATPDLASSVRARIAQRPVDQPARVAWFTPRRALAAAAVLLLFLLAAALAVLPGARDAVADLFGVRGITITIERDDEPTPIPIPAPAVSPVGPDLSLGREVTLTEARATAPFTIHVPDPTTYGEPDEIYLRTLPDGNIMVSLIYHPAPGLPEAEETGVGALLMQFEAREDVNYIMKGVFEGGGDARPTTVNDTDGWWVSGASRIVLLDDPSAACCPFDRPSANVLLWEEDGLTFRLESSLTQSGAIALAESTESRTEEES
ncbi:MAG: hypothetical protein ACRDJH_01025 [Thermomicrobiales bacterium]